MYSELDPFKPFSRKIRSILLIAITISPLIVIAQDETVKRAVERQDAALEPVFTPILVAGCRIFFVEESGLEGNAYLQAYELEEGSEYIPDVEVMVRTVMPAPGDRAIGRNTFERYLTRLETAISQENIENLNQNDLVTKPIGLNRSVAISRQSDASMKAYQYSQMETDAGESFRARREPFLSVIPGNDSDEQIAILLNLCPDLEELAVVSDSLQ